MHTSIPRRSERPRPIRPGGAPRRARPARASTAGAVLRRILPLLLAMIMGPMAPSPHPELSEAHGEARDEVVLQMHDRAGRRLGWDAFRSLQENGRGEAGDNDVLLDPRTLTVIEPGPLYPATGRGDSDPAVARPSGSRTGSASGSSGRSSTPRR